MRTLAYLSSLLLIFMIPWEDVINLPTIGTAAKSVGILMAVLWLGAVLLSGKFRKPAPFHIVAGIFILWNVASILWSNNSSKTINHLITIVQLYALTVILWDLCTTELHLLTAMQMYILGAYVASGNTLYNYFSGTSFYYERFSADGTNPDDLGIILAIGLGMAWYLAVALKPARFAGLLRMVNYSYIPVAFLGIALSASLYSKGFTGSFGLDGQRNFQWRPQRAIGDLASGVRFLYPSPDSWRGRSHVSLDQYGGQKCWQGGAQYLSIDPGRGRAGGLFTLCTHADHCRCTSGSPAALGVAALVGNAAHLGTGRL